MFQSIVRQQVAEHVLLKCTSRSCAGLSDLLAEPRGRPEDDRGGRNDHAGCFTKVSCGASSLPHARDEHPRYQTAPRGDPGVRSVNCCARRAPFRSPSVGRFCARIDSKLDTPKICSDGRVDVDRAGYLQLLGYEKRFHTAWVQTGKARCEHMSSAVHPISDSGRTSRHVRVVP